MTNPIPLITLALVLFLIIFRQWGKLRIPIWQIMLGGAVVVLATGSIAPSVAWHAVNLDVLFFLFGMFVIGQALEESGYLAHLTYKFFKNAKTVDSLFLFSLFGFGLLSALLMNDTIAIVGTPVVLLLAKKHRLPPKPLLLALMFAVTIGSVLSPIGNPQNLLIALAGKIPNPFLTFLKYLLVPTLLNLLSTYFLLKFFFRAQLSKANLTHSQEPIKDHELALLAKLALALVLGLVLVKIVLGFSQAGLNFRMTYIALLAAAPILLRRSGLCRRIDWPTLIFFAAMFVLMESVWRTGFFQLLIHQADRNLISATTIFGLSLGISQLISNVPLVALYLPLLAQLGGGAKELIALAAGSTIAGNLFILGAASNVIVLQNAEKRQKESISFWEFARIGIPLTIINSLIYLLFLQ